MGKIITFSGPRGVGKTSIMDDLRTISKVNPIVPYTTRDPRPYEADGQDYHFVSDYEFDAIRRTRGMFDVLTLRNRKYGTPIEEFDKVVGLPNDGPDSVRTINLAATSALELRKEIGVSVVRSIFVLPECWQDIEKQMRDKGIPDDQIQERRLAEPTDLTLLPEFDMIVINSYGNRAEAFNNVTSFISRVAGVELQTVQD